MLSRPRKPPSKTFLPSVSLRLTHHVKLRRSFWNAFSRKSRSATPVTRRSILYTRHAAHACTGGVTAPDAHSEAGVLPVGGVYPPRKRRGGGGFAEAGGHPGRAVGGKGRARAAAQR